MRESRNSTSHLKPTFSVAALADRKGRTAEITPPLNEKKKDPGTQARLGYLTYKSTGRFAEN
jgi:hypothetical protein